MNVYLSSFFRTNHPVLSQIPNAEVSNPKPLPVGTR